MCIRDSLWQVFKNWLHSLHLDCCFDAFDRVQPKGRVWQVAFYLIGKRNSVDINLKWQNESWISKRAFFTTPSVWTGFGWLEWSETTNREFDRCIFAACVSCYNHDVIKIARLPLAHHILCLPILVEIINYANSEKENSPRAFAVRVWFKLPRSSYEGQFSWSS